MDKSVRLPIVPFARETRSLTRLVRSALLPLTLLMLLAMAMASFPALAQQPPPTADLGDAPDSTNSVASTSSHVRPAPPISAMRPIVPTIAIIRR